ncbi:MAG: NAD-glutamate dehydrogenase [Thiotrichaceae bacterium]|nr:NAD-glutamate dehydrogenase [Thiotrichaceae bacterium]
MDFSIESKAQDLLQEIASLLAERFPETEAQSLQRFTQQFYHDVAAEDLLERNSLDLYGAALAAWHFIHECVPNEHKVRVYNPQFEQHGWQSAHTIINTLMQDMPFLVDSIRVALNQQGLTVHLVIHPVFVVSRNPQGELLAVIACEGEELEDICLPESDSNTLYQRESLMHIEVDRHTDPQLLSEIAHSLSSVLNDVHLAITDWQAMRQQLTQILQELATTPPPVSSEELQETQAFLHWISENRFTFLGYREYQLAQQKGEDYLQAVPNSGLGILRSNAQQAKISHSFSALPPQLRKLAYDPHLLLLTKANSRATVHRPSYMDYIGIKRINAQGQVTGEWRFLGLYTAAVYHSSSLEIPVLREKVQFVMENANYRRSSHRHKALLNILESYPRDELFQISAQQLSHIALGILQLQERQRIRVFVRSDTYGRFVSCIVFVPRDHYDTDIRGKMQQVLLQTFDGTNIESTVMLSDSVLAQVHFVIHTPTGSHFNINLKDLETRLIAVTLEWHDHLYAALMEHCGEERGTSLFRRYQNAFPVAYRADFSARHAVYDIERIEQLQQTGNDLGMSLYCPIEATDNLLQFKIFHSPAQICLSEVLPMLENMGVRVTNERSYHIQGSKQANFWLHEFSLLHQEKQELDLSQLKERFHATFERIWRGEVENDGFNRLVLRAGFSWREIVIFRAYCKYLRQAGSTFSQLYIEQALANNPEITRKLLRLFYLRCDPQQVDGAQSEELQAHIQKSLDRVSSLDEDRILRRFLSLILATLRTNYFQQQMEALPKPYLAFKFDPSKIPELPEPRPMFEISVYSPRMEGVHLRGGKVARGGIRWSDRLEDFRTEILGLVKAQRVKNALIVPVGAKGGFVIKTLAADADRQTILAEAIHCYQTLIRGLLDLTDNIVAGQVIPPPDVVRHDEDDPYLVVAADKGTASFSDIANAIAKEYHFWLGDAFASGGSAGYDHKKMGITARGAWDSVKRHFRTLGVDVQQQAFTVVGIGDMAGDVFGNGMLLSPQIKLVAAFNYQHIFLDPNPDPTPSLLERRRLFNLPRSTWADYDVALISTGGGVFERKSKSIALSPEIREVLAIKEEQLAPADLIRALLRAPVDLLWNGGIGTYVKAHSEHHIDVNDRANDALRINGEDLRCKVVGEGGNLGFTQLGRVEYALKGGRIYTDAIDNSGGVDCSDHEVNLKILLNAIVAAGDLTEKQRDQILAEMTDSIGQLLVRDNYLQTQAVSLSCALSAQLLDAHTRFMHHLEQQGKLDRYLERLPDDKALAERRAAQIGLTSPELCVLLAYSKISLYEELLASDFPEDAYLQKLLLSYFPQPLPQRFPEQISQHRLHREIIATLATNQAINHGGLSIYLLSEETGLSAPEIMRAFLVAWEVFGMQQWWAEIEALDSLMNTPLQLTLFIEAQKLMERATRWLLRNHHLPLNISESIASLQPSVTLLARQLYDLVTDADREVWDKWSSHFENLGAPADLARGIASFLPWLSALDIVEVASQQAIPLEQVAVVHFNLGNTLKLNWLRDHVSALPRDNRWTALSRSALRDELYRNHRALSSLVIKSSPPNTAPELQLAHWMQQNQGAMLRCQQILNEIGKVASPDLSMLSVALREIRNLV